MFSILYVCVCSAEERGVRDVTDGGALGFRGP